ncbi:MAG: radical SAM protein [Leptolyngbyaceae cyanobacterium SL_7_1]|nr:radical SAM protein [Leptolyngbyaceae cyanobacterium SL_7_1]
MRSPLELHLYPGNQCNRDCSFCTVFGSPKGWHQEYTAEHLDAAHRVIITSDRGVLKFYGGEPTLHPENVIWAIAYFARTGI